MQWGWHALHQGRPRPSYRKMRPLAMQPDGPLPDELDRARLCAREGADHRVTARLANRGLWARSPGGWDGEGARPGPVGPGRRTPSARLRLRGAVPLTSIAPETVRLERDHDR